MKVNPNIFKAYDIRGIWGQDLNPEIGEAIGRAFARLLQKENGEKKLKIVVGMDMRLSSPTLQERVMAGLVDSGLNVVDVGLVSTPAFYFAVAYYGYDGGVQVSASHNPKEYNGFKMVRARAMPVGRDTGMNDLKEMVLHDMYQTSTIKGEVEERHGVVEDMVKAQSAGIPTTRISPLTIVVDAANAMGAIDVEAMFAGLPCKLIKMNFELDGSFPVHQPDPLDEKNLAVLREAVLAHKADMGIAPDGDGDRYFFVDEKGDVIRQEILRGIMAQIALHEHPGATVCYDIRPGRITRDMIEAAGGKGVVTPVGHSLIKQRMLEVNAVFGGESSGHYFYQFSYGTFEAPVPLVLKFLLWVSEQKKPLSEILAPYRKYFHSGEINSEVASVPSVLERIKKHYATGKITLLDGVSVEFDDFWFNVRGSNTEPLIRLNLEAKTEALMNAKRDEVLAVIRES
ncbi:MAG: phosphomannomutase/phosphoglucomutase [Candidatus Kerfeldbacteria bacterium]|nr:phosphomannomutase/phosphoglucomutase [Candidatus Kerfeldbacteria bacterium]